MSAVPRQALAHARVLRTQPENNARVSPSPARVELWFNELLDEGFNRIEVFPAHELGAKTRANLTIGAVELDPVDRTHISVPLPRLAPGEYVVEWRVLARDGHSAPGRSRFVVLEAK